MKSADGSFKALNCYHFLLSKGFQSTTAEKKYSIKAIPMTTLKPKWTDNSVAKIALNTEAQPFTAQAQGINSALAWATLDKPKGKGMPIKKANGAMRKMVIGIFHEFGNDIRWWNVWGRKMT